MASGAFGPGSNTGFTGIARRLPQAVVDQTRRDIAKWREVIAKTGIKAE